MGQLGPDGSDPTVLDQYVGPRVQRLLRVDHRAAMKKKSRRHGK